MQTAKVQQFIFKSSAPAMKMSVHGEGSFRHHAVAKGQDFWSVKHDIGAANNVLPVWVARPGIAALEKRRPDISLVNEEVVDFHGTRTSRRTNEYGVTREDIPSGVDPLTGDAAPNLFVLSNVLSAEECDALISVSETMGYTNDAPVSLARDVRKNDNVAWVLDKGTISDELIERVKSLLPTYVNYQDKVLFGPIDRLNNRWHFFKYDSKEGGFFKPHKDGGSDIASIDEQGNYVSDRNGKTHSWMTFLLYLNDGYTGGSTDFYFRRSQYPGDLDPGATGAKVTVQPRRGSVVCFWHGEHPLSPLHEGSLVTSGTKYVAYTSVLFDMTNPQPVRA